MKRSQAEIEKAVRYLRGLEAGAKGAMASVDQGALASEMGYDNERDAATLLADLSDAGRILIERRGGGCGVAVYADRTDDSDEISARIAAQQPARFATQSTTQKRQTSAEKRQDTPRQSIAPASPKHQPARGSMPSIEWVQLDRLQVDDSYQRSIDAGPSKVLIARIGREWDWRLCVPLMVSRRADGLFVIDGQHRLSGARLRDDVPQLPCCISVYAGPADEAAMFVAANRERRAMNRLDDFHAAQAGGDKDALAVAALIESVGFTVSRHTGSAAWALGEVAFTSAIAGVRRKHGDGVVRDALQAMADAFPDERLVAGSFIFTAICRVLVTPPKDFDRERLFKALLKFDMKGWASFIAQTKGGDTRASALREMLLAAYDDLAKEKAA